MASIAAPPPFPHSTARAMATLAPPSPSPSPHRRHSAPHSTARATSSPSPHRLHSAPHSTTPLAASSPSPDLHSAPTSPPRRVESIAAASPSPHRRHSAPHPTTRAMALLAASSPSPHRRHSAPDSTTPLASSSHPSPDRHSTPTSPPRRVDAVRVYAVAGSSIDFIAELGRARGTEDGAEGGEEAKQTLGRVEERGDVVLAFMSKGHLCGVATLLADAPVAGKVNESDDGEDGDMEVEDDEDCDREAKVEDESGEEDESEDETDTNTSLVSCTELKVEDESVDGDSDEEDCDMEAKVEDESGEEDESEDDTDTNTSLVSCTELKVENESVDGDSEDEEGEDSAKEAKEEDESGEEDESEDDTDTNTSLVSCTGLKVEDESDDGDEEDEEGEDSAKDESVDGDQTEEEEDSDMEEKQEEGESVDGDETEENSDMDGKVQDESEDEDDNGLTDWEAKDVEKQEIKSEPTYSLKIRVWPSCGYANIVLADEDSWISTTSYSFSWLSKIEVELMLEKLAHSSQNDMKVDVSQVVSNAVLLRSDYEGLMVNSPAAGMFVKLKLSPRLHHFNVQNLLGKGAYANVRLCTAGNQKDYAMKIIRSTDNDISEPREVAILSSLRSAHVVKFLQGWTESNISVDYEECSSSDMSSQCDDSRGSGEASGDVQPPRYVMIQMELCQWTLANYLSKKSCALDDEKALEIFEEIIQSVQYIHGKNVIHRDIKPSNIFMGKDNKFKLGDFGQSRVKPRYTVSFKGTPNLGTIFYAAPELDEGERMSDKVDIYSLGAIYFDLFHFFKTAMDKDKEFTRFKEDNGSNIKWSADFYLFKQMIALDPVKRPSVNVVSERISQLRSYVHRTEGIERDIGTLQQEEKKLVAEIKRTATAGNEQMDPGKQMKVMQEFQKQSAQMDMTNDMMSDSIDNILDCYQAEEETEDIPNQLSTAPEGRIAGKKVVPDESSELDELETRLSALKNP